MLELTSECDPSSPEENAAIVDENDLRTQIANRQAVTPELRDPNIHCGSVGCDSGSAAGGGCCIIATVVSKSLASPQVQFFRSVRDHLVRSTEIGHAFFEKFFRDYYSFSPQVYTIMARNPSIPGDLLEGYINPLLDFWKIMIERSQQCLSDSSLGAAFVRLHSDRARAESRLDALHRTVTYWLNQDLNDCEVPQALITLLRKRAWLSDRIQWTVVAPVRIYQDLLTLHLDDADEETMGREFNRAVEYWAPEVPISDVWASLPAEQVVKELEFCDKALLQSTGNKKRFRERLRDQFHDITSIGVVLNGLNGALGDTR